jgi:hypothetical protein
MRGRATFFAVAIWAAVAAVGTAIVAATLRVWRRWLSVEQAVLWTDRRATLDDRLTTLLLDPPRARSSRLKELLLEQILAASPRWDVETLAPRRVPRSVYVFLAALAALIATSFLVRAPATPTPASDAMRPRSPDAETKDGMLRSQSAVSAAGRTGLAAAGGMQQGGDQLGIAAPSKSAQPGEETEGSAGSMPAGQGLQHRGPAQRDQPRRAPAGSADTQGASGDAMAQSPDDLAEGVTAKLQNSIREALGAQKLDRADERRRSPDERGIGRSRPDAANPQANSDPPPPSANAKAPPQGGPGTDRHDASNAKDATGPQQGMPGTGSAANPGAQAAEAANALFGKQNRPGMPGSESATMRLKLGAFAAMQTTEIEPQRQPPSQIIPAGGVPPQAVPPRLADEQIPDAPLQKADIAPEHEAVVRRIFTRE